MINLIWLCDWICVCRRGTSRRSRWWGCRGRESSRDRRPDPPFAQETREKWGARPPIEFATPSVGRGKLKRGAGGCAEHLGCLKLTTAEKRRFSPHSKKIRNKANGTDPSPAAVEARNAFLRRPSGRKTPERATATALKAHRQDCLCHWKTAHSARWWASSGRPLTDGSGQAALHRRTDPSTAFGGLRTGKIVWATFSIRRVWRRGGGI